MAAYFHFQSFPIAISVEFPSVASNVILNGRMMIPSGHLVPKWRRSNVDATSSRRIDVNTTSFYVMCPLVRVYAIISCWIYATAWQQQGSYSQNRRSSANIWCLLALTLTRSKINCLYTRSVYIADVIIHLHLHCNFFHGMERLFPSKWLKRLIIE